MIEAQKPQYVQIADLLRSRIADGTYPAGSQMPSEPELSTELGVSRVTVNRAITMLRSTGDVKVRRGAGTFVRKVPKINRDAVARYAARGRGTGAGQVEVQSLKRESRTEYREIGKTKASSAVAQVLGLKSNADVLVRRRVLFADGEPTQIADSYYPWSIAKDSKELLRAEVGTGGSYGRLEELGHGPVRFTEDVTVRMPSDKEQRALDLEASQPVFEIWHVAYTAADLPVEVCVHVMPGYLWNLRYAWEDRPSVQPEDVS
jgi:GntR family transcriptional regulator